MVLALSIVFACRIFGQQGDFADTLAKASGFALVANYGLDSEQISIKLSRISDNKVLRHLQELIKAGAFEIIAREPTETLRPMTSPGMIEITLRGVPEKCRWYFFGNTMAYCETAGTRFVLKGKTLNTQLFFALLNDCEVKPEEKHSSSR